MSVDTRTPRTPTGDRSSEIDDAPALSMVKVPSDPAQVIVNNTSFRVELGASARRTMSPRVARHLSATQDTARVPVAGTAEHTAGLARRRPVVWSGHTEPDDTGAHRLLQAVRAGVGHHVVEPADAGATQVIPRVGLGPGPHPDGRDGRDGYGEYDNRDTYDTYDSYDDYDDGVTTQTLPTPVVGAQRTAGAEGTRLLPAMRGAGPAYDEPAHDHDEFDDDTFDDPAAAEPSGRRHSDDPARHAYYPGRRMNLGVVLLPLRVFLGAISIYAGMGKLCDPVYFDGGERGSMVKWLNTLHPWEVAEPLRQFALQHPVGSGLVIAFLQVIVGVLTVLGCWQRVAAVFGAGLSAALLVTVSWKSVPAYDAPDIIYLAAWSPLIIAGAPVYSVDGRLAGRAWRRLGPRAELWDLRRFVLRRGALVTFVVTGLTLLVGSLLGGAVRDADRVVVPGPGEAPRNEQPGSPLPVEPGERERERAPEVSTSPTQGTTSGTTAPTAGAGSTTGATSDTGTATSGSPSRTQGTTGQAPPQQSVPAGQAPSTSSGPTSGGTPTGGDAGSGPADGGGSGSGSDSGGGAPSSGRPGLVGGLLG